MVSCPGGKSNSSNNKHINLLGGKVWSRDMNSSSLVLDFSPNGAPSARTAGCPSHIIFLGLSGAKQRPLILLLLLLLHLCSLSFASVCQGHKLAMFVLHAFVHVASLRYAADHVLHFAQCLVLCLNDCRQSNDMLSAGLIYQSHCFGRLHPWQSCDRRNHRCGSSHRRTHTLMP